MPREIGRDEAQRLVAAGAQLVEVLPGEEYEQQHLPGALSIPLKQIDSEARDRLDADAVVIVYCWDSA